MVQPSTTVEIGRRAKVKAASSSNSGPGYGDPLAAHRPIESTHRQGDTRQQCDKVLLLAY